jgi:hypothetical protein
LVGRFARPTSHEAERLLVGHFLGLRNTDTKSGSETAPSPSASRKRRKQKTCRSASSQFSQAKSSQVICQCKSRFMFMFMYVKPSQVTWRSSSSSDCDIVEPLASPHPESARPATAWRNMSVS